MSAAALPACPLTLQAPDSALLAQVGGMGPVANSALSEVLEPAVAAAMKPYEGVAVPESERIEQNADELESLFRCAGSACRSSRWCWACGFRKCHNDLCPKLCGPGGN